MFEQMNSLSNSQNSGEESMFTSFKNPKFIWFATIFLLLISFILISVFLTQGQINPKEQAKINPTDTKQEKKTSTSSSIFLPKINSNEINDNQASISAIDNVEKIAFGDFYHPIEDQVEMNDQEYPLPFDAKKEVVNYYELIRKLPDFDPLYENLNENGFMIVDKLTNDKKKYDFWSAFKMIDSKGLPVFISNDFLLYYYQNNLKEVFKQIEADTFYNDLWLICQALYKNSEKRYYEELRENSQSTADPFLEALRMETAYFAVALELLRPKNSQVSPNFDSKDKFNQTEANKFFFSIPNYLSDNVSREIEFITALKKETNQKSPVLLYKRNYTDFNLPKEYKTSAKLSNFYLASLWLNSYFPLYYQDEFECADCVLDKNDWKINMITAGLISIDIYNNPIIKERWARVYKILSYFRGLSKGLTYLDYYNSLNEETRSSFINFKKAFTENQEPELEALQANLKNKTFIPLEGGLDANIQENYPQLGMRLLQNQYWPNDYIFKQLTHPLVLDYFGETQEFNSLKLITGCKIKSVPSRCFGTIMDLTKLFFDLTATTSYEDNINYDQYDNNFSLISQDLNNFNLTDWHSNNYWNTISFLKKVTEENNLPNYMLLEEWQKQKTTPFVSAGFTNIHLPLDILTLSEVQASSALSSQESSVYFIEPNLTMINEIIANISMLKDSFLALKIINANDLVYLKLNNLINEATDLKKIILKELANNDLNENEINIINDIVKKFEIKESEDKILNLDSYKNAYVKGSIIEDINDIRFISTLARIKGKLTLVTGPIFNLTETRRSF